MALSEKFSDIGVAVGRLYKIADMAELCGDEAAVKVISDVLDRAQRELEETLEELAPVHGDGL